MKSVQEGIRKYLSRWSTCSVAATLFFFLTFGSVCFYITKVYKAYLNSDAAVANILAGEIWRTAHFFPPDWWYVNSDLWIAFTHVLVLPWVMMGYNGFSAHAFAVVLSSTLMLASAFALLRQAGCTRTGAAWGISILCLGYSDYYLETVYGEAAYSLITTYLLLFLVLVLKIRQSEIDGSRRKSTWIWLAVLVYIVGVANPVRFLAFDLTPLISALIVVILSSLHHRQIPLKVVWPSLYLVSGVLGCLAAFGLAYFSHRSLLPGLSNALGASGAVLVPIETLPTTIGYALLGILTMLGIDWIPGMKIASIQGLILLARLCLYPMLVIAPAIALGRNSATIPFGQKLVTLIGYIGLSLILLLVVTSTLQGSGAVSAIYTTRYVLPFILIILLSNALFWPLYGLMTKFWLVIALTIALIYSWSHISPAGLRQQSKEDNAANIGFTFQPGWRLQVEKNNRVIRALQEAGLKTGYAPYWHSHIYTILSNGSVEVRPLHMEDGSFRPWLDLSSSRWYKSGYADGEVFFLIPLTEKKSILPGLVNRCSPLPNKQFEIEDYLVVVFETNPLLGSFDRNLDSRGSVCLGPTSLTQIGKYDVSRSRLYSPAGSKSGLLHYGPYGVFEPGNYTVIFQVDVGSSATGTDDMGYVEVTADNGETLFGRKKLLSGTGPINIPVFISGKAAQGIEFRVFSSGLAEISLKAIDVVANGR